MMPNLTFREMNLRVFQGQPIPYVLFQPRFEPWYAWHQQFGGLPGAYRGQTLLELFDSLPASMRYVHYYTGMPDPIVLRYAAEVKIHERTSERECTCVYETPYGELVEVSHLTVDGPWRTVEFAVRRLEDLRKLRWLYQHATFFFSAENFLQGSAFVGGRGVPQFWLPKSPYQALAQQWMKLPDLIYALADARNVVEETMRAIDAAYDPLYEGLIASGQVQIVNFGENIHEQLLSPRYFERYLSPFYEKRSNALRQAGIFTHVHIDGYFRALLKYLKHLPFDGLEALTPLPQGDVSSEDIEANIGDKILLDGIPAVLFMPTYSREELMQTVERIVVLFHPRLVLGISDELPQGSDADAMERVKLVADYCLKAGSH